MARKHGLAAQHQVQVRRAPAAVSLPRPSPSPRRRQILAARSAAQQQAQAPAVPPPVAPRPPVHCRRRALPERVVLRIRLGNLTPRETAVLRALARCRKATPRDIVRNVRGVEDARTILNRLVELGLAARRPDDRRGRGRRAQWVYGVSTLLVMGLERR